MNFIYSLANMSLVQILIIGLFLSGIYYFTGYNKGEDLVLQTTNIQTQIKKTEEEVHKKQANLESMKLFKRSVQEGGSKSVQHLLQYIPNSLTTANMFSYLTKEAKAAGVNIVDKRDAGILEFENFYEVLKLHIKCSGSFSQIVSFLSKLTNQTFILTTDEISMVSSVKDQAIQADMNIYGYRYVEEKKEKQKKEEEEKEKQKQEEKGG